MRGNSSRNRSRQRQRDVDIRRLLHVDPQIAAGGMRARGQVAQMAVGEFAIDVEAELRELDRRLAREPQRAMRSMPST